MKNNKIVTLILILSTIVSLLIFTGCKGGDSNIIISFEAGEFDVSEKDIEVLLDNLDKSKKYRIEGYSCDEDNTSDAGRLAAGFKRSEAVSKVLTDNGFPVKNITTTSYDKSSECKAVVVGIE